ncbi:MAG: M20 family metallopeptidase [Silicimonas sp.]|nr:M20 family metallopeptidase [Silicimonas sp.]
MPVRNRFAELHSEITGWRRDLHQNPELLFDVHETAAFVTEKLKAFGCDEVVTGIGQTGVVGLIRGKESGSGRVVGLRADMDALPIHEETGLDYASKVPGKMHACGHDGHTAMLLGAAQYLAETRNFDGTVAVIFQPAEEGGGGGREMVEDGMMEQFGINEVYGMHNWPGAPAGSFAIRPGPMMAATDVFDVTITGVGAHGAKPNEGVDTVVVASHVVTALQSIVSRNLDPVKELVVSVTSIESSSTAYNVIPERVHLKGTVRSFDDATHDMVERRFHEIVEGTAKAFGASAEVDYQRNYPATVNHLAETEFAAEAARRVAGTCEEAELTMGAEDFSFMLNVRPGAYILVGNGDTAKVHQPTYNFNDDIIPSGCSWWVEMAESRLPLS